MSLEDQVADLESRVSAVEEDNRVDHVQILDLYQQLYDLRDRVDIIDSKVADHEARITRLEKKRELLMLSYKALIGILFSRSVFDIRDYQEIYGPIGTPGELPDLPSNPDDLTGQVVNETTRVVGPDQANAKVTEAP